MTDRIKALTVVLGDIREDDAEPIIAAIRMLRGVVSVEPHVANFDHYVAKAQAKDELRQKIFDLWKGMDKP